MFTCTKSFIYKDSISLWIKYEHIDTLVPLVVSKQENKQLLQQVWSVLYGLTAGLEFVSQILQEICWNASANHRPSVHSCPVVFYHFTLWTLFLFLYLLTKGWPKTAAPVHKRNHLNLIFIPGITGPNKRKPWKMEVKKEGLAVTQGRLSAIFTEWQLHIPVWGVSGSNAQQVTPTVPVYPANRLLAYVLTSDAI